jgi:AAA+ ATPase superfamily predicted ATPase
VQGLEEKYEIVESRKPLLSSVAARNRKYYVKDRFLRAFLGAIGPAVKASLLPFEKRQAMASTRLNDLEGPSFERLYRLSVMEAVLKGRGPISLASPSDIGGFWSKNGEVDLLAIDNSSPTLWAISCKRSESKHSTEGVQAAQDRAQEFLGQHPQLGPRKIVMVCASPSFSAQARRRVGSVGGHPLSLEELCWF